MISVVLSGLICAAWSPPPDHTKSYFKGLDRPSVPSNAIDPCGGPVILIVVDALRPDHLGAYGWHRNTTPHLDQLADEGIILTNYHVNSNWTRPSMATLLTGLLPAQHGVENERDQLSSEIPTLPEILRGNGVPTAAVIGNGNAGSAFGLARGFDRYFDTVEHWDGLPTADEVFDLAMPFVERNKNGRFFLTVFLVDPHDPYHAPDPYEDMFIDKEKNARLVRSPHWELGRYSADEIERMVATYDGAIRYTDAAIGRFLGALKRLRIYDRSTIIVTSDHGEAFGEHGVFLHSHHLFEELVRAPMIIRAPKMSHRGAYNYFLFQSIDVMPTILNAFDATADSPRRSGLDILAALARPESNDPNRVALAAFHNFGIKRTSIRNYTYKVVLEEPANEVEFRATVGRPALLPSVSFGKETIRVFDLASDPFERQDLFSSGAIEMVPWRDLLRQIREYRKKADHRHSAPLVRTIDSETYRDLRALGYVQ